MNPNNDGDHIFRDVLDDELIIPEASTSSGRGRSERKVQQTPVIFHKKASETVPEPLNSSGLGRPKRNVKKPARYLESSSESSDDLNFDDGDAEKSFDDRLKIHKFIESFPFYHPLSFGFLLFICHQ